MYGQQLHSLALKDYQQTALDGLEHYLAELSAAYQDKQDYYDFQKSKGKENALDPQKSDYCSVAWVGIKSRIVVPHYTNKKGQVISDNWHDRIDGIGRKIPNISFKVPTGGGKTLLAACALGRIMRDYFKTSNGLVLWVVPSTTIYEQTIKALSNKEHPYRMQLDIESGGRTKILERGDRFEKADIENQLCVMVIMLQSFNVSKNSKDARKVFSDTGSYQSFFPNEDDYLANKALVNQIKNLVEDDMLERNVTRGINIKHSLGNVFRLCHPVVIIDEEHKAKSPKAIDNINDFNPKFILEFSATPRDHSNTLIDIAGHALKQEAMIKLPIRVDSSYERDWKTTLNAAYTKLNQLSKDALKLQGMNGTYIRPIMVIIAEAKKKNETYDHVEGIKKYLIDKCQIPEQKIRIKIAESNQIKDEDLLLDTCPVQFIITKDALREGWDCPFASILTVLTQVNSENALTQYIGRVLRQPYASTTPIQALNEAYVYCSRKNVGDTVNAIKKGLEAEGMGDITDKIITDTDENIQNRVKVTQKRNDNFKDKIFLPTLSVKIEDEPIRPFDYYKDIFSKLDWSQYHCSKQLVTDNLKQINVDRTALDYENQNLTEFDFSQSEIDIDSDDFSAEIDYALLCSLLSDLIPNSFQAWRILDDVIHELMDNKIHSKMIALSGHHIVKQIKDDAMAWLLGESEKIFAHKLENNEIILKLLAEPLDGLNWKMADERTVITNLDEYPLNLDKNLFQPQFKSNYNVFEYNVASYLNQHEAIKWWHRLGVRGTEYAIQGWKKEKIYPDFLIFTNDKKFYFIETKGDHLDNSDSAYKQRVFEYLNKHANKKIGEFNLVLNKNELSFNLIFEAEYKEKLIEVVRKST